MKDNAMIELKPCPFCDGEADFARHSSKSDVEAGSSPMWFVWCKNCLAGTDYYDTKEEAATAWNTRTGFLRRLQRRVKAWLIKRLAQA